MALQQFNDSKGNPLNITIDSPSREQSRNVPPQPVAPPPVIELWYGDITASGAINHEDILVLSADPSKTLIGNKTILNWINYNNTIKNLSLIHI